MRDGVLWLLIVLACLVTVAAWGVMLNNALRGVMP
jgi:hypothetical protein